MGKVLSFERARMAIWAEELAAGWSELTERAAVVGDGRLVVLADHRRSAAANLRRQIDVRAAQAVSRGKRQGGPGKAA